MYFDKEETMDELKVLNKIIKERRSVFTPMFNGEKIPDEIIAQALENGNWAPNHKNTEPWIFHIFKDSGLVKLSEYSAKAYKDLTSEEKYSDRKYKKTKNNALLSSHVIAICMEKSGLVPEWEELAAVSMAIQNIWLSISAAGYGCYWSTPKYALEADDFLRLNENEKCFGFLYVGVPKDGLVLEGKRKSIDQKLRWITE